MMTQRERVEYIFWKEMKDDTSFNDNRPSSIKEFLFGVSYSNQDMRETWDSGIKHGIEIGLRCNSLEGQRIELDTNTSEGKSKEFLEKFYKLADEYNCAIQYHPEIGLTVRQLNQNKDE